eukprot:6078888-Amphidinium_carterae.2
MPVLMRLWLYAYGTRCSRLCLYLPPRTCASIESWQVGTHRFQRWVEIKQRTSEIFTVNDLSISA